MILLNTNWYKIFYWITVADGVKGFFDVVSNLCLVFTIASFILYWIFFGIVRSDDIHMDVVQSKYWLGVIRRTFMYFTTATILFWAGYVFTPNKKALLFTVAGGAAATFLTNDTSARALPADLTNYLHLAIKEQTKSLSNDSKEELGVSTPASRKESFMEKASSMTKEEIINYLQKDSSALR